MRLPQLTSAVRPHRGPNSIRPKLRGFTLLEILVVLAIIGMLAGLAISQVEGIFGSSHVSVRDYPSTAEGLQALITSPGNNSGWNRP